jgi:adenylate cyclase
MLNWRRFTTRLGALPARRVTWALALAFCVWAVLDVFALRLSSGLANSTYDAMVRARFYAAAPDPRIVIVDIDEASLAQMAPEFGRWPWPRDTLATVLDALEKQKPQAIAWDVLFSDADRLSPGGDKAFDEAAKRSANSHFSVVRLPAVYDAQSKVTRDALRGLWLPSSGKPQSVPSTVALIAPVLPAVAAGKLGYNNGYLDTDGVLRRYRLQETLPDGSQIQSMALSVAHALKPKDTMNSIAPRAGNSPARGLFGIKNEDTLISWRAKANQYPRVPFADVFAASEGGKPRGAVPSFAGKIVIVGSTASSLHDTHPTPLGAQHAGVDSLATAIDNAVHERHLAELPRWLKALLAISLCIGMAWWVQQRGISSLDAALLILPAALLGISYLSLNGSPIFIDLHLSAGIALLFIALLRTWNGWRRNFWTSLPALSAKQSTERGDAQYGVMALALEAPAADVGLDTLIRVLEQHAPACRVIGGDATATWPAQLRWPELHQTVAIAGPVNQLSRLQGDVLPRLHAASKNILAQGLRINACAQPLPIAQGSSRILWAHQARQACAGLSLESSTDKS